MSISTKTVSSKHNNAQEKIIASIERSPHDKEHPYTMVSKAFVQDMTINLELKGLLLYCFSQPNDWKFNLSQLSDVLRISMKKCWSLINQGINAGYIKRDRQVKGNLHQHITYFFSEHKSFSNNFSDTPKTAVSEELFEKYQKLERENAISNNFSDTPILGAITKYDKKLINERSSVQKNFHKRSIPTFIKIQCLSEHDQQVLANQFTERELALALEDAKTYHKKFSKIQNFAAFLTSRCKYYRDH